MVRLGFEPRTSCSLRFLRAFGLNLYSLMSYKTGALNQTELPDLIKLMHFNLKIYLNVNYMSIL